MPGADSATGPRSRLARAVDQRRRPGLVQFDAVVELYNEKFARPTKAIISELKKRGKNSVANFDDPIEWS